MRASQVDLNLLVALDALLGERNVTRAAEKLHLGQPAMSASLARLRRVFDDPLLVRNGRSLTLTPLAQALVAPLHDVIVGIENLLTLRPDFDPCSDARDFTILASDYVTLTLLRHFVRSLEVEAPKVRVRIRPLHDELGQRLERGTVDLLIVPSEVDRTLGRFPHRALFEDRYVCVVWAGNAEVGDTISAEDFSRLPQLGYDPNPLPALCEARLEQLGVQRNVEVKTQTFVLAPMLVRGTRLLAFVHERIARELAAGADARVLESPYDLGRITETMFWNPRTGVDPAHRWLRDRLADLAAEI